MSSLSMSGLMNQTNLIMMGVILLAVAVPLAFVALSGRFQTESRKRTEKIFSIALILLVTAAAAVFAIPAAQAGKWTDVLGVAIFWGLITYVTVRRALKSDAKSDQTSKGAA